jgi:hypothetical protein
MHGQEIGDLNITRKCNLICNMHAMKKKLNGIDDVQRK